MEDNASDGELLINQNLDEREEILLADFERR